MPSDEAQPSRRRFLALPGALLLASCALLERRWTYRYRLIVKVRQNGRIYEGSSVVEVKRLAWRRSFNVFRAGISGQYIGEAAAVTLGSGQTIFALLQRDQFNLGWAYYVPHRLFAKQLGTPSMVDEDALDNLVNLVGSEAIIAPKDYPMLVYFPNPKDPASVTKIDPAAIPNDLGTDTKIVSISIRITKDPIEHKVEKIIPWISRYRRTWLNGDGTGFMSAEAPLSALLSSGSFIVEREHPGS